MWSLLNILLEYITIFSVIDLVLKKLKSLHSTCIIKGTQLYLSSILLDSIVCIEVFYIEYFLDKIYLEG